MLYEKIEEKGLDYVLRKYSLEKRISILKSTPSDELVMYSVIGITPEELTSLFSRKVFEEVFSRLCPDNLFYFYDSFAKLFTRQLFRPIFLNISQNDLLNECKTSPMSIVRAMDKGVLTSSDIIGKLRHMKLEDLFLLKKWHSAFEKIIRPVKIMLVHSIFPIRHGSGFTENSDRIKESARKAYSRDIAMYITEFL
jgi:hypothetical protein